MSYPPYQRSAKKNQSQQSDQHNDNPFKPTASTSSNVPSIFKVDNNTKIFHSGLGDRPSKVTLFSIYSLRVIFLFVKLIHFNFASDTYYNILYIEI